VNRKIYKYAQNEYRHKASETQSIAAKEVNLQSFSAGSKGIKKLINDTMLKLDKEDYEILNDLFFKNTSIHQLSKKLDIVRPGVR